MEDLTEKLIGGFVIVLAGGIMFFGVGSEPRVPPIIREIGATVFVVGIAVMLIIIGKYVYDYAKEKHEEKPKIYGKGKLRKYLDKLRRIEHQLFDIERQMHEENQLNAIEEFSDAKARLRDIIDILEDTYKPNKDVDVLIQLDVVIRNLATSVAHSSKRVKGELLDIHDELSRIYKYSRR